MKTNKIKHLIYHLVGVFINTDESSAMLTRVIGRSSDLT